MQSSTALCGKKRTHESTSTAMSEQAGHESLPSRSTVTFLTALLTMLDARSANLSVDTLSSNARAVGAIVATMLVLQLPPSESLSRCVSLESR